MPKNEVKCQNETFLSFSSLVIFGMTLWHVVLFPIAVVYCGPTEWRFERRRGSSCDRKNTVRHLIQMMSITECNDEENEDEAEENTEDIDVPLEFIDLYNDHELRQTLVDLIHSAADLDILDFKEFCRHIDTPKPSWSKTQATTGKHIPVYWTTFYYRYTLWQNAIFGPKINFFAKLGIWILAL